MAAGIRHTNFGPRVETDLYLKRAQQIGKSLITASTQWTDFGLMALSQHTAMPKVVTE